MTDALTIEPKSQFKNWHDRKPIKELDDRGLKLVEAMTFGVDDAEAAELGVAPYKPLTLEKAADAAGLKRRNARWLYTQPVFLAAYSKSLSHVRSGHKARAVATMAEVMDDPGENTAADRTVRLKAAQAIMGDESKGGTNVNVQINQNTLNLQPGIVIRLPASAAAPPLELEAERETTESDNVIEARAIMPGENQQPNYERTFDETCVAEMSRQHPHTQNGDQ